MKVEGQETKGAGMKGSCLCGALEYQVGSLAGPVVHCHCRTCRKAHSAVFASTARADREQFRWTRGESQLGSYASTPGKLRWFCRNCGSHLMAEWLDQPQVIVRVASLDEDPQGEVKAHIWVGHDLPWLHYGDELAKFSETP